MENDDIDRLSSIECGLAFRTNNSEYEAVLKDLLERYYSRFVAKKDKVIVPNDEDS